MCCVSWRIRRFFFSKMWTRPLTFWTANSCLVSFANSTKFCRTRNAKLKKNRKIDDRSVHSRFFGKFYYSTLPYNFRSIAPILSATRKSRIAVKTSGCTICVSIEKSISIRRNSFDSSYLHELKIVDGMSILWPNEAGFHDWILDKHVASHSIRRTSKIVMR